MRKIAIVSVLEKISFRYLWLAQLSSQIGLNLLVFVLALQVYSLTLKNTAVSILTLSFVIPAALLGVLAGIVVDRYDKKIVLFLCNILRALAVIGFIFSSESLVFIYVLGVIISAISQFFVPAEAPIIPSLVPKRDLLTANGVFTLTIFITMLGGGLLAGPFLDMFGVNSTFVLISVMFLLASFFITQLPGQKIRMALGRRLSMGILTEFFGGFRNGSIKRLRTEFAEGHNYLLGHKSVLVALLLLVGSQTVIATCSALLPGFADKVLRIPVNDASVVLLGPAILGIVAGAIVVSQFGQRLPRARLITVGVALVAICLIVLGFARVAWLAQLLLFITGFGNALIDVSSNTTLQMGTDESVRSRVYGILTALAGLVFILPVLASGGLSDLFGVDKVFIMLGALILLIWFFKARFYVTDTA